MRNSVGESSMAMQIPARIQVQNAKHLTAIFDATHTQVADRIKFPQDTWRDGLAFLFLTNIDGILPRTRFVTWPEVELVLRPFCALVVDQCSAANIRPGCRQVERNLSHQAVVAADNEHFLPLQQQFVASLPNPGSRFAPTAH